MCVCVCVCEQDLTLDNLQCHKTQPTTTFLRHYKLYSSQSQHTVLHASVIMNKSIATTSTNPLFCLEVLLKKMNDSLSTGKR